MDELWMVYGWFMDGLPMIHDDLPSSDLLHSELENHHRNSGCSHLKIVIFRSHVRLPEGRKNIGKSSGKW